MRDVDAVALRSALDDLFAHPFDSPVDDDVFNDAALRVFAYQYGHNTPYRAFCDRRSRTPASTEHWTDVPAVPTAAFKEVALVTVPAADADAKFLTSGTTRGTEKRGVHYVADISLYHRSLLPAFAACLLPDGARPRMLSFVPSMNDAPESSLSHMADVVMDRLGDGKGVHCATVGGGIDAARASDELRAAERAGRPVCLLGTSFAYVHWLDEMARRGERFRMPAGSRLMDTGGYKGHGRQVEEMTLRAMYAEMLGLDADYCVNEYGMTEMLSQFYDSTLRDAVRGRSGERRKIIPPWVRTRIVHPETLEPVPPGEQGLLQHFDLANAGSVMAVQTEDVGSAVGDGFRLFGRAPGAMPRGCSIAMDMLLEAAGKRGG